MRLKLNPSLLTASLFALTAVTLIGCSMAESPEQAEKSARAEIPHVFPEATALEIQSLMAANPRAQAAPETEAAADKLKDVVDMGSRLYKWLETVNAKRAASQKLSFSTKSNVQVFPVDQPKVYNAEMIRAEHNEALSKTPASMRAVLEATGALPEVLPVSDQEFLDAGLLLSRSYDGAARWIMMAGYLNSLKISQIDDVRGYLYLSRLPDVEKSLDNYRNESPATQEKMREALVQMCLNNQSWMSFDRKACVDAVQNAVKNDNLFNNYKRNLSKAQVNYNEFYQLDRGLMRDDITWSPRDPQTLHYPFLKPSKSDLVSYLSDNIEDEFKMPGFQLRLDFTSQDNGEVSRLVYQTGVTPHAERGRIVMDENEPITEWSSQWTIRHEFGHLLGFPDCYVEFYDDSLKAIVNYQLDVTDLMCSRKGVFQKHHYDRLNAAYYK